MIITCKTHDVLSSDLSLISNAGKITQKHLVKVLCKRVERGGVRGAVSDGASFV